MGFFDDLEAAEQLRMSRQRFRETPADQRFSDDVDPIAHFTIGFPRIDLFATQKPRRKSALKGIPHDDQRESP